MKISTFRENEFYTQHFTKKKTFSPLQIACILPFFKKIYIHVIETFKRTQIRIF
jgi:hypothetical protein